MINVSPPTNFVSLPQSLPPQPSDQPFDLLLGSVSGSIPEVALTPAVPKPSDTLTAEAIESGETLLAFLGFNPIKAPPGETVAKALPTQTEDDDDVIATDFAAPPSALLVPQYQPIAAAIAASNPVAVQPGAALAPEAPTREDRATNATTIRNTPVAAPAVDQITDAAIIAAPQNTTADISPEPFAAAANAASVAGSAPAIIVASTPASLSASTTRAVTRPAPAETAVAASIAALAQGRTAQNSGARSDAPEERIADTEILSTSPSISVSPLPTSSLTNGPTTPIAVTQADPLQTIADRQLDLARDTRWIDELARDIVTASGRSDRLSFSLIPPQLGQLHVDLSHGDQGLSVHMRSDSEATTQIVGAAQPRLVEELKSQGIRVASTEVSTGGGQSQGQSQQQRGDGQLFEFARQRFDPSDDTESDRPGGRFA